MEPLNLLNSAVTLLSYDLTHVFELTRMSDCDAHSLVLSKLFLDSFSP